MQHCVTKNEYECQIKEREKKCARPQRVIHFSNFSGKISIKKKEYIYIHIHICVRSPKQLIHHQVIQRH